jgi:hypothetical protein
MASQVEGERKNEMVERRGESNKAILDESKAETLDLRIGPVQR